MGRNADVLSEIFAAQFGEKEKYKYDLGTASFESDVVIRRGNVMFI